MEIVINRCFGGFNMSRKAFLRLRELGHAEALAEPDYGEMYSDGSGPREHWGIGDNFGSWYTRNDPLLAQVVRELGAEANGMCASLVIVEIPDGVEWEIAEYDGNEHVAEKHRTWG